MISRISLRALLVVLLFASVSCARRVPVENISNASYPNGSISSARMRDVREAIVTAGTEHGWIMQPKNPGHIVGTLNIRAHQAIVDIYYNESNYSILYHSSEGLHYDGSNIHHNYNTWITNLNNRIRARLASL